MIRKIFLAALILLVVVVVIVFWGLNPGTIHLDLGLLEFDADKPAAFVGAFVFGWLFGLVCVTLFVLRLLNQRRKLRKQLRLAEAEVSGLRSLPMQDAVE